MNLYQSTGEYVWQDVAGLLRAWQWMRHDPDWSHGYLRHDVKDKDNGSSFFSSPDYGLFARVLKSTHRDVSLAQCIAKLGGPDAQLIADAAAAERPARHRARKWKGTAIFEASEALIVEHIPRDAWKVPLEHRLKAGALCSYRLQFSDPFCPDDALLQGPSVQFEIRVLAAWAMDDHCFDLADAIARRIECGLGQFVDAVKENSGEDSVWMPLVIKFRCDSAIHYRAKLEENVYQFLSERRWRHNPEIIEPLNDGNWFTFAFIGDTLPQPDREALVREIFYGKARAPRKVKQAGSLNVVALVDDPHHFSPAGQPHIVQYRKSGGYPQGSGMHKISWLLVIDPISHAFVALLTRWGGQDQLGSKIENAWSRAPDETGFGRRPERVEATESHATLMFDHLLKSVLGRNGISGAAAARHPGATRVVRYWSDVLNHHFSDRHPNDVDQVDLIELQAWADDMVARIWRGDPSVRGSSTAPALPVDVSALSHGSVN